MIKLSNRKVAPASIEFDVSSVRLHKDDTSKSLALTTNQSVARRAALVSFNPDGCCFEHSGGIVETYYKSQMSRKFRQWIKLAHESFNVLGIHGTEFKIPGFMKVSNGKIGWVPQSSQEFTGKEILEQISRAVMKRS
jgi:hypothetical protein